MLSVSTICNSDECINIHIHVKVRTFAGSNETLEWTSQFYLNNPINEQVHTQTPYNKHGPVDVTNEGDFIFTGPSSDGLLETNTGQQLMPKLNHDKQGYIGTFNWAKCKSIWLICHLMGNIPFSETDN